MANDAGAITAAADAVKKLFGGNIEDGSEGTAPADGLPPPPPIDVVPIRVGAVDAAKQPAAAKAALPPIEIKTRVERDEKGLVIEVTMRITGL